MATTAPKTPNLPASEAASPSEPVFKAVSANPTLLDFPTDRWGFTSDIKRAVLKAASGVKGQKDKHDMLLLTLGVLAKHIIARYEGDKAEMVSRAEADTALEVTRNAATWAALGYTKKEP